MKRAAYLQITRKCNNECIFCSNPAFDKELCLDNIEKRLKFYKSKEIKEIIFSGGEPTENKILPQAIRLAKDLNFSVKIITNGVNLADLTYVQELKEAGLDHLHVSLHTHIEKDSDLMTQRKGHFKKTIKGIKNCINEDIRVDLNTTINSYNTRYLSQFINYLIVIFPEIKHYVFNNLDIGEADTTLRSKAWENQEIIARFVDLELELAKAVKLLIKNQKSFRIERVPLCYMQGFEHFATETRKIVKNEEYSCIFLEKGKEDIYVRIKDPSKERRIKVEKCNSCSLNKICAGLCQDYYKLFGDSEIFPIFSNLKNIKSKIN